jgi:hypothetical protein
VTATDIGSTHDIRVVDLFIRALVHPPIPDPIAGALLELMKGDLVLRGRAV